MRIAIPTVEKKLAMHFGHCQEFAMVDVNAETDQIEKTEFLTPPPHEPGVLPRWLAEQGATVIVAGGMGTRAQDMFIQRGIKVVVGAPPDDPETVAKAYIGGTLETGSNVCDH